MVNSLENYIKKKDFLVCIDSDGCAMDTMNIKHIRCFAPLAVSVFGLQEFENDFNESWHRINLFSMTRGTNRFKALYLTFKELFDKGYPVPKFNDLEQFCEVSPELSNSSLINEIKASNSEQLKLTLKWSNAVNATIKELGDIDTPFDNVKSTLSKISQLCDVAVVSSANFGAIESEWTRHSMIQHTDILLGQESGNKSYCIKTLLEKGYDKKKVLMVGDAPGDMDAALQNKICFFPIIVKQESYSWLNLNNELFQLFVSGQLTSDKQNQLINNFIVNLEC